MSSATDLQICSIANPNLSQHSSQIPAGVYSAMHSTLKCSQCDSPVSVRLAFSFVVLIVVRRDPCHKFLKIFVYTLCRSKFPFTVQVSVINMNRFSATNILKPLSI